MGEAWGPVSPPEGGHGASGGPATQLTGTGQAFPLPSPSCIPVANKKKSLQQKQPLKQFHIKVGPEKSCSLLINNNFKESLKLTRQKLYPLKNKNRIKLYLY